MGENCSSSQRQILPFLSLIDRYGHCICRKQSALSLSAFKYCEAHERSNCAFALLMPMNVRLSIVASCSLKQPSLQFA